MRIQTFTIVAGSAACNATCPFCVSKMTGKELDNKEPEVNWRNLDKAAMLAKISSVSSVLITGKGEPTLAPDQITKLLMKLQEYKFPLIELQTNALSFGRNLEAYKRHLKDWYNYGLNTIAISVVDYRKEKNKEVYAKNSEYIDLESVIKKLHELGYSIRLCCMLVQGYIDSIDGIKDLVAFAKKNNIEQLTIRPIVTPKKSEDTSVYEWTKSHTVPKKNLELINKFLEKNASKLMTLDHGAVVYDYEDQNICNSDCLTIKPDTNELRQLIFFPDGHLRYDWQYKGAIIL